MRKNGKVGILLRVFFYLNIWMRIHKEHDLFGFLKFVFSKKDTKIEELFSINLTLIT